MKNFALKYIVASACVAMLSIGAVTAQDAYIAENDFENNTITITGTGAENEKIVFQILKKDKLFTGWTQGSNANDFILWQDQVIVDEDKEFQFEVPYSSNLPAGEYNTRIVSNINGASYVKKLELVGTDTYSQALTDLLSAATISDYASLKNCIDGGDGKVSPVGFDISLFNKITYDAAKLEGYAAFVAGDGAADFDVSKHFDSDAIKSRSAYFTSYVLVEALKEGGLIEDIKSVLGNSSLGVYESQLWKDLCDCVTDSTEWSYFTGKLEAFADDIEDLEGLENAIIKALILTETRYADGNDIKNVIVTLGYGEKIGISNPSTKNSVYSALNGRDYTDIDSFIKAYEASKKKNESSGSGNGGSTSSSSGDKTVSMPTFTYDATLDATAGSKPGVVNIPFVDIEGVAWASEAIVALADKGIISGKGDGYFEPDENVTREEFTKIIVCASGLENASYSNNSFTDVNDSDWFCKYVNIAYENGLVNGMGDGSFGTGNLITRQDMAVILCNALKAKGVTLPEGELTFEDKDNISEYALSSVEALHAMGAINGVSETQFDSLGFATRAQAAQIIYGVLHRLQ